MDTAQALALLRAPFPAKDIQFRIAQKRGSYWTVLAFLDARQVVERLTQVDPLFEHAHGDPVFTKIERKRKRGKDEYKHEVAQIHASVDCELTVTLEQPDGLRRLISRSDVGEEVGDEDDGKLVKTIYSDALKRAAVNFGIGSYLYNLPDFLVKDSDVEYGRIQPAGLKKLRGEYQKHIATLATNATNATPVETKPLSDADIQVMVELATASGIPVEQTRAYLQKQDASMLTPLLVRTVVKYTEAVEVDPVNELALYRWAASGDSKAIAEALHGSIDNAVRAFDAAITSE